MSRTVVIAIFLVLLVLHQDFWLKDDASFIAGIVPIGLVYHMMRYSYWLSVEAHAYRYQHYYCTCENLKGQAESYLVKVY